VSRHKSGRLTGVGHCTWSEFSGTVTLTLLPWSAARTWKPKKEPFDALPANLATGSCLGYGDSLASPHH
jgi:hypothetical protein